MRGPGPAPFPTADQVHRFMDDAQKDLAGVCREPWGEHRCASFTPHDGLAHQCGCGERR